MQANTPFASNTPLNKFWAAVGIALAVTTFLLDV